MNVEAWNAAHPYKPCPDARCCAGSYETRDARRVLTKIENCATCKGLTRVPMDASEIRIAYRAIRTAYCERAICSWSAFDERASRLVVERGESSDLAPGHWLAAARTIAGEQ